MPRVCVAAASAMVPAAPDTCSVEAVICSALAASCSAVAATSEALASSSETRARRPVVISRKESARRPTSSSDSKASS